MFFYPGLLNEMASHDVASNICQAHGLLRCVVDDVSSAGTLRLSVRAPALAALRAGFAEVDLTAYLGV